MAAKPEYRDRPEEDVAVLDALVDRRDDGMTVFELRAAVDADIDRVEEALTRLKQDDLITVDQTETTLRVYPHDCVVPDRDGVHDDDGLIDSIRRKLGL